jgi:DNA-binding IclR family transcriptional regulator
VPPRRTPPRSIEPGRLSSVATAVRLLKAFSEQQVEIGISDLAKRLGVAKSTVHRLAVTLVAAGMLEQNSDSGKYRLGIALFRLGSLVRRRMTVSNEARPLLRELREKVNETVHLAVLDGHESCTSTISKARRRSACAPMSACASRRIAPPKARPSWLFSLTTSR